MVTCKLWAQTANQMFMMAATYAYSLRHNMDYAVPKTKYTDYFPNVKTGKINTNGFYRFMETKFNYNYIPYYENLLLEGYFQAHEYWKDFHKEVVNLFNLRNEPLSGWVACHQRRGDYLTYSDRFPPVTKEYIEPAMKYFAGLGHTKFLMFSDGMDWVKENYNSKIYPDYEFQYSDGKTELEDLILMSNCEHGIIANSSYSLMARLLCRNENAINLSPNYKKWFGEKVDLDTSTIIPSTFIQQKI